MANVQKKKAIQFVLSDAYMSLTNEERRSLLHEGVSMSAAISAFGEFPIHNDVAVVLAAKWVFFFNQLKLCSTTQIIGPQLVMKRLY